MRRLFLFSLLVGTFAFAAPAVPAKPSDNLLEAEAPQWKGKPYAHYFQLAGLAGLANFSGRTGVSLFGAAAVKILHEGFVDDINDQAFVEVGGGPVIVSSQLGWVINMHLRWDFHKNDMWTFYATGGLGSEFSGAALGNVAMIYPRFSAGALWNVFEFLSFRGEVSHEFLGIGIVYLL